MDLFKRNIKENEKAVTGTDSDISNEKTHIEININCMNNNGSDQKNNKKTAESISEAEEKKARRGLYSIACVLILIAIFIFINLSASRIPSEYSELDISGKNLFTFDEQTIEIVNSLNTDIEIYWLVQSGNENKEIEVLLNRYDDLSANITVNKVDPIVNPDLVNSFTSETVNDNSLIVAGENRSRYIDYNEIFAYNYNYFTNEGVTTGFNGETLITSAIDYIGSGAIPKIYRITGHDEIMLSTEFEDKIEKNNFTIENLNLTGITVVPDDADCILIAGAKTDMTTEEAQLLKNYLEGGGKLLVYTDYGYTDMPNLIGLLESYGVNAYDGLVFEGDTSMYYMNYPMQLMPEVEYHDITSSVLGSGYTVLVPMAHGLKIDDTASTNVVGLLNTSDAAYAKTGEIDTVSKSEDDTDGPFSLGVAIDTGVKENNARIVWYSSSELLNKEYDQLVNGANTQLAITSMSWLTNKESALSIPSKTISNQNITVPGEYATKAGILLICIVPTVYLAIGAVISFRRKRR